MRLTDKLCAIMSANSAVSFDTALFFVRNMTQKVRMGIDKEGDVRYNICRALLGALLVFRHVAVSAMLAGVAEWQTRQI